MKEGDFLSAFLRLLVVEVVTSLHSPEILQPPTNTSLTENFKYSLNADCDLDIYFIYLSQMILSVALFLEIPMY